MHFDLVLRLSFPSIITKDPEERKEEREEEREEGKDGETHVDAEEKVEEETRLAEAQARF